MNTKWHTRHILPRGAPLEQRIAWHRDHQEQCACRPTPANIQKEIARPRKETREPAIDAYLATVAADQRRLLQALRKTIHAVVRGAEECISYRLPAFRLEGKIIAGFSATSKGCSDHPFSGRTLNTLAKDIDRYSHTKSALHFGPTKPLPTVLVRKLLKARIAEGSRRRSGPR